MKSIYSVVVFLFCAFGVEAQSVVDSMYENGVNKWAYRPVHESDIMHRKTVVRGIDLRERQNRPMFGKNREITKLLINAVKEGTVTAYQNDSLTKKLSLEEFQENLTIPGAEPEYTEEEKEMMLEMGDSSFLHMEETQYYLPSDLYQLELKEEVVFDKEHSLKSYHIIAITIYVPADHPANVKQILQPVASFSYKELVEELFRDNPEAIWFNAQNDSQHKNLAEAFELRLFSSYLLSVSNPAGSYLIDMYGGDPSKGVEASEWAQDELLEEEHNLWDH
ncbi:gliding motility protein GldN [Cytophagaceae bacterium ABcell3]|nr:gliding motility protein GldN [Cytophagaceae bacterium ABcell3]